MKAYAILAGASLAAGLFAVQVEVHGQGSSSPGARAKHLTGSSSESASVGSQTCRECHASTHSSWTSGRHSKMLQPAGPGTVIPAFQGSLNLHGKDYRLEREGDSYFMVEAYLQEVPTRRRVDYALGSRRVQHYLTTLTDGRIVVLPPSYDVEKKEWFHNLDIVDLEESGEVKVQVWNQNCFGCHVSGEQKGFDPDKKTYATTWTDFGTSCERCHGPGRTHSAKYATQKNGGSTGNTVDTRAVLSPRSTNDRDTAIVHPRHLDPETATTLCAQCHSLRDITQPGFQGGDSYYDYFTPLLEYAQKRNHDPAYWANGRPRRFSNEAVAFWQSQCFFKGGATCLDCHTDVHEPDIEKNVTLAQKQDALCSGCHREIARRGSEHSRHQVTGQSAVACVSCHMPKTVISLRHRMPDHTISVPAPENTTRFGIPNACNECHQDKDAVWSEMKLAAWFPEARRKRTVADAAAFTFGAQKNPLGIPSLVQIALDASRPPLIRANALGYLRGFDDPQARTALLAAASDPHPAIRLAATLSLADQGKDPAVRGALEHGLSDARRTVRMAAALGLLNASSGGPPASAMAPAMRTALGEHVQRARFLSEDASTQLDLGKMFFLAGQWKSAETSVRDALRLDPRIPGGNYFLGLATLGQGRIDEAKSLLRGVPLKDPHRKDAEAVLAKLKTS